MSKGWEGGSDRAWRKYRRDILFRDGGLCQIQIDEICLVYATQVHHKDGVRAGRTPADRTRCCAACEPCNSRLGDPATNNPQPNPPATNWD